MKKLLLGLGTVVAVATPIVAVVSCGDNNDKPVGNKTIEIKQTTVEPHIQVNTINKITQGTLTVSEIDKVHHTLLIESFKHGGDGDDYSSSTGIGLTTVQGTKEMYSTFGLEWHEQNNI